MHVGCVAQRSWQKPSGSERRSIVAGDLDIIPPGYHLVEAYDRPSTVLTLQLSVDLIERAAEKIGPQLGQIIVEPLMGVRDSKLQHLCLAINEELKSRESTDSAFGESLGIAVATRLVSGYGRISRIRTSGSQTELHPILEYIDAHLDSDLTLKRLASAGYVSIDTLKRLFREAIGVSAHRYVVERRVAYALSLLKHSQSPIKEIALQAGFYDQSHMTKWMRRVAGVTPSDVKSRRL
jgi:AraC family transcriptional regulator